MFPNLGTVEIDLSNDFDCEAVKFVSDAAQLLL
jgi:hypothetical protein